MDDLVSRLQQAELAMPLTFVELKARQIENLKKACNDTIIAGFESYALGIPHIYTLKPNTDQHNLVAAFTAAQFALTIAKSWTANVNHTINDVVLVNNVFYICGVVGTSGSVEPVWPTEFQEFVSDGTTAWAKAGMLLATSDGIHWHTPMQIIMIWQQYLMFVNKCRVVYAAVKALVEAATTEEQVIAITYSLP